MQTKKVNFQSICCDKITPQKPPCCPPPFAKAGDIKTHSSVCLSLCMSVTKTLNLAHIS